jgi:hypothetical protein
MNAFVFPGGYIVVYTGRGLGLRAERLWGLGCRGVVWRRRREGLSWLYHLSSTPVCSLHCG